MINQEEQINLLLELQVRSVYFMQRKFAFVIMLHIVVVLLSVQSQSGTSSCADLLQHGRPNTQ